MKAKIKRIVQENLRVKTFIVEPEQPVSFKTGQAMRWNVPGVPIGRLFSISSPGGDDLTELWFTIGIVEDGKLTPHINKLAENDTIELAGPFGKFIFDAVDRTDVALLAGGTGISVLHAILRHITDNALSINVHLVFSVLTKDDMIYKEELERLARDHDNVTVSCVVTESHPEWTGRCGFITKEMFDKDFGDYHQRFYICGPEGFIDCGTQILKHAGVPDERIHIDRWSFYNIGTSKQ